MREFNSTIKLQYPIRGAKFLKICNTFSKDKIFLVKCNLIDQKYSYTNIRDGDDFDKINIFNSQIVFLGYEGTSDDLIKIDESKSLINEFTLSIKNLNNDFFNASEISKAFIKFKIYHD